MLRPAWKRCRINGAGPRCEAVEVDGPLLRTMAEPPGQELMHLEGHSLADRGGWRQAKPQLLLDHAVEIRRLDHRATGQRLISHAGDAIKIHTMVGHSMRELFGSHVSWRAKQGKGARERT